MRKSLFEFFYKSAKPEMKQFFCGLCYTTRYVATMEECVTLMYLPCPHILMVEEGTE